MYIQPSDTSITIYPAIVFPAGNVVLVIMHKLTKTEVRLSQTYTNTGSGVILTLPTLTAILNVAKNLDELTVRVFNLSNVMYYEMMYRLVNDSPNILLSRKAWTTTNDNEKKWIN